MGFCQRDGQSFSHSYERASKTCPRVLKRCLCRPLWLGIDKQLAEDSEVRRTSLEGVLNGIDRVRGLREENVLTRVFAMGWEVDPHFVIIVEGVVEIEPRRRSSYANIDADVTDQISDEFVYFCNFALVYLLVWCGVVRFIVNNYF